uniref:Uncharacterized protein n=1 Tax=Magallana gigas TaxID=29159 RepID=A0A8W8K657_MAGGI
MINLAPTPCNGNDCPLGLQRSDKGICCPLTSEHESKAMTLTVCKKNCNLSDSDFYDLSPYVPPSTTLTERVTLGAGISTSPPPTTTETVYTTSEKATISNAANMIGNGASNASQLSRNKLQEEGGTGGGVIAGAIIGVLAVAGLSGLLAFFLYRRWKKNKEERKVEPEENGGENPVSQKPPVSTSLN